MSAVAVTHPSTNPARRRVTSLIETKALPILGLLDVSKLAQNVAKILLLNSC